ncbi:MAG: diguanylate cyclase [Cytophagales bacterium]|nr:diguanylate cyclase [Rhizobacter sp.]
MKFPWSRRRSIRQELVIGVALVHAVLMSVFVVDLVLKQRGFLHQQHLQRSTALVQGIARQATVNLLAGDIAALQEIINGFKEYPELRYATVLDPMGKVLAHSNPELAGRYMDDEVTRSMIAGPRAGRTLVDTAEVLDLAMPIERDDQLVGWVRFSSGTRADAQSLRSVAKEGVLYALVAIALGVALALWMARTTTKRLYALLNVADATRAGQRDVRAQDDEVNEIGRLAGSFNAMLDALREREQALELSNLELEQRVAARTAALLASEENQRAILDQANDAFVSMDSEGRVLTWNGMAEHTFGWTRQEAMGAPLSELIIPPQLRAAHAHGMARYLSTGEAKVLNRRVELIARRRDGLEFPVELSLRVRRQGNDCFFDGFLRDISERKLMQRKLEEQALQDPLTALPNRRALLAELPTAMGRAERSGQALAVLFLDLDGFKGVNDCHGHDAGDEVLREFARRLRGAVRLVDKVARLAGDEFVVIAETLATPKDAQTVAAKVLASAQEPFVLGTHTTRLSSSIGIGLYLPGSGLSPDQLLSRADDAMYQAKRNGKAQWVIWNPEAADLQAVATQSHDPAQVNV